MSAIRASSMSMMLVTGARRAAIRGQAASTKTASKLGQDRPGASVRPQKCRITHAASPPAASMRWPSSAAPKAATIAPPHTGGRKGCRNSCRGSSRFADGFEGEAAPGKIAAELGRQDLDSGLGKP